MSDEDYWEDIDDLTEQFRGMKQKYLSEAGKPTYDELMLLHEGLDRSHKNQFIARENGWRVLEVFEEFYGVCAGDSGVHTTYEYLQQAVADCGECNLRLFATLPMNAWLVLRMMANAASMDTYGDPVQRTSKADVRQQMQGILDEWPFASVEG